MKQLLNISEVSEMLGVAQSTLREWDRTDILKSIRTVGGHRRYLLDSIKKLQKEGFGKPKIKDI
jgi:putative resolvase